MAPNITSAPNITGVLFEDDTMEDVKVKGSEPEEPAKPFKAAIVWRNVIIFAYLHAAAIYGAYLIFTSAKLLTTIYGEY